VNETYEGEVHVLRRNLWFPLGCLAVAVVGLIVQKASSEPIPFVWLLVFWAALFGPIVAVRNAFRRKVTTAFRATRELLELGDRTIPTSHIAEAKLLPRRHGVYGDAEIALVLRDRTKIAVTTKADTARRLLRVLGIAEGERRTTFALVPSFAKRFGIAVLVLALAYGSLIGRTATPRSPEMIEWLLFGVLLVLLGITPLALILALVLGLGKGKLVIGADGFTVRWVRSRFVRFDDVAAIDRGGVDGSETRVTLRSRKRIALRAHDTPDTEAQKGAEATALYEHLRAAFALAEQLRAEGDLGTQLQRQQRSPKDWLRGLDLVVSGGASGYRHGAITPEMLQTVVRSSNGEPDLRVGAAAALVRIAPAERENVRIAAEACAENETRHALLALADAEDDEAIERALASVNKR
jgi:hypothetical protein